MAGRSAFPPASWTAYSGSKLQQSTDAACGRVTCGPYDCSGKSWLWTLFMILQNIAALDSSNPAKRTRK